MALKTHYLAHLSRVDVKEYLETRDTVIIPIASMEQHGPHLPLACDTIQAEEMARRAGEAAGVIYTPTVWMGYSPQHMYRPGEGTGTITIRPDVLADVYYDVARSLIYHGFNRLLFLCNHGSNTKFIEPVLRRVRNHTGALVMLSKLYAERYMGLVDGLFDAPPEETPGWHASELETSQVLAVDPSLVRMDRAVKQVAAKPDWFPDAFIKLDGAPDVEFQGYQYFSLPMDHSEFTPTGIIGNPLAGTAEKGEEAYTRYAAHLVDALAAFAEVPVEVHTRAWGEMV